MGVYYEPNADQEYADYLMQSKRHELRRWDTMPDVEGWYWLNGKYKVIPYGSVTLDIEPPEFNATWHGYSGMCKVTTSPSGNTAWLGDEGDAYDDDDLMGTFLGPIPNPFK